MAVDGICTTVIKQPRLHMQNRRQREVRQGIGMGMKLVEETDVFVFHIPSELEVKAEHREKEEDQGKGCRIISCRWLQMMLLLSRDMVVVIYYGAIVCWRMMRCAL